MSEFCAEEDSYQSFVVSFERDFLKQAIGTPADVKANPSQSVVVDNLSNDEWDQLLQTPSVIKTLSSETEKEFRLRKFIFQAMENSIVRDLFYNEIRDWGVSIEYRISSILEAHYLSPLRVSDLALLCGMSLSSFKRYFNKNYDTSPRDWLRCKRLNYAYRLAEKNELSVQEICEAIGYRGCFKLHPCLLT